MSFMKCLFIPFIISALILALYLSSCTYSINMIHTQGQASDVVDETQDASPDIDANVSIPAL